MKIPLLLYGVGKRSGTMVTTLSDIFRLIILIKIILKNVNFDLKFLQKPNCSFIVDDCILEIFYCSSVHYSF